MIPRIIHQSWKVAQVPERWRAFQNSWRELHPDFEYRFWTDVDNRAFVAEIFPEFLALYDGYKLPIMRADLARYLVVCHFGGVYVDMDFEALKPLDTLLEGRELFFAPEPTSHLGTVPAKMRGLKSIICNAIFASVPRHPFWAHFFPMLEQAKDEKTVMDVTGPYLLSRACETYPQPNDIMIVDSALLYPIYNSGLPVEGQTMEEARARAYAIHHWQGTWWREAVLSSAFNRIKHRREIGAQES